MAPPGPPSSGAGREADLAQWTELTGKSGAAINVSPVHRLRISGPGPSGLSALPMDNHPANRARGEAILQGRWKFGSAQIETPPGHSPWGPEFPSLHFADRIHRFHWLRDLAAWSQIREIKRQSSDSALAASAPNTSSAWMHVFTEEEIRSRMTTYRNNLSRIIELCGKKGIPVVIGTVPSNLWKLPPGTGITRWPEVEALYAQKKYEAGRALAESLLRVGVRHQSSEAENEIIRELGRLPGVSLADVKAAVIAAEPNHVPGETLFNDHCHLNPAGNKILIQTYEPHIVKGLQGRGK